MDSEANISCKPLRQCIHDAAGDIMTATLAATYLSTLLDNENHPLSREAKRLADVLNKVSRDFPELRRAAARETLGHRAVSTDAG